MDLKRFDCIAGTVRNKGTLDTKRSSFAQDVFTYEQWTLTIADHGYYRKLVNSINGRYYVCDFENNVTEHFPEVAG